MRASLGTALAFLLSVSSAHAAVISLSVIDAEFNNSSGTFQTGGLI